jgi:transposase
MGNAAGVVAEAPGFELTAGPLTEEQAHRIYQQGEEAVVFALLTLSKWAAEAAAKLQTGEQKHPSTPSGMVPVYEKPAVGKRAKTPGRKPGHPGARRPEPEKIHRCEEHTLQCCPDCGSAISKKPARRRRRIIEDIQEAQPEATEHTIQGYWCGKCRKIVEPVVPDALPGSTVGNRLLALSAWLHYGLGNTLSQIVEVLNFHLHLPMTCGGLMAMWHRLQEILYGWYEEIGRQVKQGGVLHADETGWRVAGKTHWLWCFATPGATYYMIDRSRGEPALKKFFTELFEGTLITDFWKPYERVKAAGKQKCFAHLFRELKKVDVRNKSPGWGEFRKRLMRLLRDALRLEKREDLSETQHASRRARLHQRLGQIIEVPAEDADAKRLAKRLARYQEEMFTFLDPTYPRTTITGNEKSAPP